MDITELEKYGEVIAESVHDAWWTEKIKQGFHAPLRCPTTCGKKFEKNCEKCHADMYPYLELPENVKEYDRATVRAVLNAIKNI